MKKKEIEFSERENRNKFFILNEFLFHDLDKIECFSIRIGNWMKGLKNKFPFLIKCWKRYIVLTRKTYPKRKNDIIDGTIWFRIEYVLHMRRPVWSFFSQLLLLHSLFFVCVYITVMCVSKCRNASSKPFSSMYFKMRQCVWHGCDCKCTRKKTENNVG